MLRLLLGFVRAFAVFLIGIPITLAGLFVVPLAIPFRTIKAGSAMPFTQYPGAWCMVSLPRWALFWHNPVDGALGDKRGWWNNYCIDRYSQPATEFVPMFLWLAIRNPANYWSRIITGVDEARGRVEVVAYGLYWSISKLTRDDSKVFPLFEGFIPYKDGKHGFEWRIGWKIDQAAVTPDMPIEGRFRGSVFRIQPWATQ